MTRSLVLALDIEDLDLAARRARIRSKGGSARRPGRHGRRDAAVLRHHAQDRRDARLARPPPPRHVTEQSIRVALDLDGDLGDTLDEFLASVTTPAADARNH